MLIYSATARRVVAINGNMMAPQRATIAHYRSLGIDLIPGAGLLAAGVPAAFDALVTALRDFGTRSLSDVLEPALQLAGEGFPMHVGLCGDPEIPDEAMAGAGASLRSNAKRFLTKWPSSGRVYLPDGKVPAARKRAQESCARKFFQARARCGIAAKNRGREAGLDAARERFYRGDIARDIVAWSDANGGLLAGLRPRAIHDANRIAGECRLSRRHGLQMRSVVAGSGISAAAKDARGLRPRRDGS